jgi:DNA-binding CsgD family transcriptional regulator
MWGLPYRQIRVSDRTIRLAGPMGGHNTDRLWEANRGWLPDMRATVLHHADAPVEIEGAAIDVLVRGLARRGSPDVAAAAVIEGFATLLGMPAAVLWLPREETLAVRAAWTGDDVDARGFRAVVRAMNVVAGVGPTGRAWRLGEVDGRDDARDGNDPSAGPVLPAGLQSAIAVPALAQGTVRGVLELYAPPGAVGPVGPAAYRALRPAAHLLGQLVRRWEAQATRARLTPRELELLALAATGNTTAKMAESLSLSPWTVKTHFENIRAKLHVPDRTAAVAYAIRTGMIS